jgi:hypothetical protein
LFSSFSFSYFFGIDNSGRITKPELPTTVATTSALPVEPNTLADSQRSSEREDRPLLLDPAPQPSSTSASSSASGSSVNSAHYDAVPEPPSRKRSRSRSRSNENASPALVVTETTSQKYLRCFRLVGWRAFNVCTCLCCSFSLSHLDSFS